MPAPAPAAASVPTEAPEPRDLDLRITEHAPRSVEILLDDEVRITSPTEGLWSVATDFAEDWPASWVHANPEQVERLTEAVHALHEDVRVMRDEMLELHERMDFAERMLTSGKEEGQ